MASTRIEEWQEQLAATTNDDLKRVLKMRIETYRLAIQDGRVSSAATSRQPARYNPLIGGKSKDGIRLFLFIAGVFNATKTDDYLKFSAVRILPFKDVEPSTFIRKEDNDHTLVFDLGDNNPYRWTTMTSILLSIFRKNEKIVYEVDKWHVVDGITVDRKTLSNGQVYTNINCKSVMPWKEGPTCLQMSELVTRFFSNDRYSLRAVPPVCLASKVDVYGRVPRIINESGVETPDYTKADALFIQDTTAQVINYVRENGFASDTYGHYRRYPELSLIIPFSVPGIRHFPTVPSTPGAVVVTCGNVAWTNELITKRSDKAKAKATDKDPYDEKLTATAQSTVSRLDIQDGRIDEEVFIIKATCTQLHYSIGIMNVDNLKQIIGEILPKINIVLTGTVDIPAACTMDINTTAPVYTDSVPRLRVDGIPLKIYRQPWVPVVTMIRTCGVPITKKLAFNLTNNYIKLNGGAVKKQTTLDIKALKQSTRPNISSNFMWCTQRNTLPTLTQNRVCNLFETELDSPWKLDDKTTDEWRFYSLSNAVFKKAMDVHVQDTLRYHALSGPQEDEAQRFEEMTETLSDALRQLAMGDQSDYFATPRFGSNGLFHVIFAIHRSIDHDDIEVFKNPLFDIENCKPTEVARPRKREEPRPTPVIDDTDSVYYEAAMADKPEEKEEKETTEFVSVEASTSIIDDDNDTFDINSIEGEEDDDATEFNSIEASTSIDDLIEEEEEEENSLLPPPPPPLSNKRQNRSASSLLSSKSSKKHQRSK